MKRGASCVRMGARRRVAVAAWTGLVGAFVACGEPAEDRTRARAELEAEFGRRTGDSDGGAAEARPAIQTGGPDRSPADGGAVSGEGNVQATPGVAREAPADDGETAPVPVASGGEPSADPSSSSPGASADDSKPEVAGEPPRAPTRIGAVDVDSLLAEAERAYDALGSLRAAFVQEVEVPLLDRTAEGRGTWYQRGRDRFRMDFDDPPRDIFVADGTYLWLYQPSQQPDQVIRAPLDDATVETGTADLLGRILREARTGYVGVYEGIEELSGVPTHRVRLAPRGASPYREVEVWIAAGDALVRRFRIVEENETVRTVTLASLEPGAPLPDSLFRFEPPPGATIFER